ncbi:site-specific DNA-methyltransferase [Tsuneonella sp. CC-YZS046]|uniref:site-specific DNA-methyltransferase n=1 Tax=Tsuneonella sp. CC-YZS046 TaxID=3042152 RepID=UPI002D7980AF|nr:site-specific DNA-methyltransferase [Tsuneonella sp. CC-YZS046]WRO65516.1 site-specific DNA-methyltransferase [Tsuneonella sp. CC-YZS046]
MSKKQKLELTWVGKENRPRLEPRILIEDPAKSYHAAARVTENDIFDNVLIHGDNLLALKALEADYAGEVKCVFIDPPYNTGSAFTHYEDGLEHSIWLGLMRDRLEIIRRLLSDDGSLWITIDDNEVHYLKVMCDEIFGRVNFVTNVVWQSSDNSNNDAKQFSTDHNHILVYSKKPDWLTNKTRGNDEQYGHFKNTDNDPRGPWFDGNPLGSPAYRENLIFDLISPQGHKIKPPANGWRWSKETLSEKIKTGEIRFTPNGKAIRRRTYLWEQKGLPPSTLWTNLDETGHNRQAKFEQKKLFPEWTKEEWFGTPKPERLLKRILDIATSPGDLVLDSFAGSGTTGAVAHKMGRRWVMVELGDHCATHIVPRLQKVIEGSDQGGISKVVEWQGGGGFRYYDLGPSLLETDKWGREVISKRYDAAMLAQALCKLEGFTYAPSSDVWWQQGYSSETDFLYVTTQTLGPEELAALSDDVGDGRSLLVLCAAWRGNADHFTNLTLRKIPNHIRSKCEWGHDDYSLNVANLPMAEADPVPPTSAQGGLFDGEGDI